MRTKKGQPADQIPYAITIEGEDEKSTWRALPGPSTTIGELHLACREFNLVCQADRQGRIALVPHEAHRGPVPDSADLARVMWGLCIYKEDPHGVSRSDAGSILDDDPTPDEEGEPATTWLEHANTVAPR